MIDFPTVATVFVDLAAVMLLLSYLIAMILLDVLLF